MKEFLESADLLQTIVAGTEMNSTRARELVSGLSEVQLNWKPSPGSWSVAQCLEHLTVATEGFDQYFEKAIATGREKRSVNGAIPYRPTRLGGWLIKQLVPEATRKVPAPKIFRPAESSSIEGALERFLQQQKRFVKFVKDATGIDYNKTKLRSPVTPLLRYSLADAFVITVVHGRRHLGQAQRVREAAGFPS